jgi:signal transduction histidine kinase
VVRALLRVPLAAKLAGANAVVVAVAAWALLEHAAGRGGEGTLAVVALALVAGIVVNWALVALALRPLRALEVTADRIWRGDLEARVAPSPLADANIARVGSTVNRLLDGLAGDRSRMRELAAAAIEAADAERARIARELHDSTAQTHAALAMQLAAAARDSRDPELAERLAMLRELAGTSIEEVRALAHSVHPRVLDDLGLVAALEWQARQVRERTALDVHVTADADASRVAATADRQATAALYRVAQESLRNVERHARARHAQLLLSAVGGSHGPSLRLDVVDDGAGCDIEAAEARRPGMGLSSMRERVTLVNGTFDVSSAAGRGARVTATVPVAPYTT